MAHYGAVPSPTNVLEARTTACDFSGDETKQIFERIDKICQWQTEGKKHDNQIIVCGSEANL